PERLVYEVDQAGPLRVIGEDVLDALARRAHPVGVEASGRVDQAERLRQVGEDAEVGPRQAHVWTRRSKLWRAIVRTAIPASVARRLAGIKPAPSTSRPAASASFVIVVSTICQANAIRASPQTSTISGGPNGRWSVLARRPAGSASLPTANRTRAIAQGTSSQRTGMS